MRVIVDSPVWSLALRRRRKDLSTAERALERLLRDLIIENDALLVGIVRQELLSGISNPDVFEFLRSYLHDFDDLPPEIDDYERAASFANTCTREGIAISTADMQICALAAGRDLPILTTDADFERYARLLPIKVFSKP